MARNLSIKVQVTGPTSSAVLTLPRHDHITRQIKASRRYYEIDLLNAIRDLDLHGVYLDVGGHCGNHSVYFLKECPSTGVIAVEPSDDSYARLKESVGANLNGKTAVCIHAAVHDVWESCSVIEVDKGNTGMNRVEAGGTTKVITLDEIADTTDDPIAFIKLDVENCEPAVLRSGLKLLERVRPPIAIESHNAIAMDAVRKILAPLGYTHSRRFCRTPTYIWQVRS